MSTQTTIRTALLVCLFSLTTAAYAQNQPSRTSRPDAPAPIPIELSQTPTELRAIGLTLFLPVDTNIRTEFIAGGQSKTVIQPMDSTWVVQVFNSISRDKNLTPSAALDAIVEQRKSEFVVRRGETQTRSLIEDFDRIDDLQFSGKQAARAYLRHSQDPSYPVTGYTIVRTEPGEFVIFQIDAPTDALPRTRVMYETIVATARWTERREADESRRFAARSAIRFMQTVTAEDIEAVLMDSPVHLRVYRPRPGGHQSDAEEIGYQIVEVRRGQAGEVDPRRARTSWGPAEREWGYLATINARTLMPDSVVDSRAIAFLSRDRQNESWRIVMEMRTGSVMQKSELILIRRGLRLTSQTILPGEAPIVREDMLPDGEQGLYLSFVERLLLPRLVAHKHQNDSPAFYDLAYYNFDPRRGGVTLRQETFERQSGGGWTGTTIPFEGHNPWNTTYDDSGEIIERTISPVEVMQRVTQERLNRLWRDKQLPITRR